MSAYRQVLDGLDLRNLLLGFWRWEPNTPEEIETLQECRMVNE